jgi:hypothetical protein
MIVRWVSAGLLEAQKHFRRIRGFRDLSHLLQALQALEAEQGATVEKEVA